MLVSTTIKSLVDRQHTWKEIAQICSEAGFDALDFSFKVEGCHELEIETREFHQSLLQLRGEVEDKGMVFNQAHAPFYGAKATIANPEGCFQSVVRSMHYASILGAQAIVVHPLQHLKYCEPGVPDQLFELNMEYYGRLKPYCEEYGIQIAVENMFQRAKNRRVLRSVCSTPEEFIRYMDHLDSRWFIGCLDIGHAMLTDEPVSFIKKMGSRLGALHVNDNSGFNDDHFLPYQGIIDWENVMNALREIGYSGDFTFEANGFQNMLPRELDQMTYTMLAQTGRYLVKKIQTPQ